MKERHELSAAFPTLSEQATADLAKDIAAHGLREPIVLINDKVLDGWNRYQACLQAGITPIFSELGDEDPVDFVLSANLHRRHLTESQRAAAVTKCYDWRGRGDYYRDGGKSAPVQICSDGKSAPVQTQSEDAGNARKSSSELAEIANVSERTVNAVKTIIREAPELFDQVVEGKLKVKTAERQAREKVDGPKPEKIPLKVVTPVGEIVTPAEDWERRYNELLAEHTDLQEAYSSLAEDAEAVLKDREALAAIVEQNPEQKTAYHELKDLREHVRVLNERINGLMNEKNAAIGAAKSWQRKVHQLERGAR